MDITPKDFLIFFSLSLVGLIVVLWVLYELYKEVKRIIDEMPTQTKKIIIAVSVCFGAVLLYSEWQDNQKREQINNSSYSLGGSFDNQNYLDDYAKPNGATAECWDGTYSFSKNRRGTCSHHDGVKQWF